jgi:23S rRNA pseudouridine1911/1915/1917 synthase
MPIADLVVRYVDEALIVVDKPAGQHTAPLDSNEAGTLLAQVIAAYPEVAALPGIKPVEPGLLHRLDQETSGLVVVARTLEAFQALRRSFESGQARKEYLAVCASAEAGPGAQAGAQPGTELRIESRFAPFGKGRGMVRVIAAGETRARVLARASREVYATEAEIAQRVARFVLLRVRIHKGFRHQVRAHLSSLGFPILGDPLYGAPVPPGAAPRMYLHATRIEMPHPLNGAVLVVESNAPADFAALFAEDLAGDDRPRSSRAAATSCGDA